jgi:hypothetical protein
MKFKQFSIQTNKFTKYPAWLKKIVSALVARRIPVKVIFLLAGVLSTIWFLIRVIPKPSRATYPCMQVAAPIMSSFVIWLASIIVSLFAFKKAKNQFVQAKYFASFIFMIMAIVSSLVFLANNTTILKADVTQWYTVNSPVGTARGINPGRVAWVHNPKITTWDGKTGFWWQDQFNNQAESDNIMIAALTRLTGQTSEKEAWNSLFTNFNQVKHGQNSGYQANQKIAVKINQNNTYSHENNSEINTSPHVLLSLLKSLINKAKVPQKNITVFDASRYITDNIYQKCHPLFPDVTFVDNSGGDGRVKSGYIDQAIPYSVDNGKLARGLATCIVEADYVINMAILKGHVGQGVTLCAKNFYGTTSIDPDWRKNAHDNFDQNRDGSPKYMTFTDFLGHKDLGEKTLLFMIDALYGHKFVNGTPEFKWQMAPFNNDWPASLLVSQDGAAIDAVGMDFLLSEFPDAPDMPYCDSYLQESALADNPPSGTRYDPERDGSTLTSLGVLEHWNNAQDKQYSRNLGIGDGIELTYVLIE